jgi:hypothetical protein
MKNLLRCGQADNSVGNQGHRFADPFASLRPLLKIFIYYFN